MPTNKEKEGEKEKKNKTLNLSYRNMHSTNTFQHVVVVSWKGMVNERIL